MKKLAAFALLVSVMVPSLSYAQCGTCPAPAPTCAPCPTACAPVCTQPVCKTCICCPVIKGFLNW